MTNLLPRVEFFFQSFYKRQKKCPHCFSEANRLIAKKYKSIRIMRCSECKLCFSNPIYEPIFSKNFYDNFYEAEGTVTKMPDKRTLDKCMSNNFSLSDKNFSKVIKIISKECTGRDLLEIGSSWGYFLSQSIKAGFNSTGIELSDERRNYGKTNLALNIFKSCHELAGKSFDVVFSSHTFEHFTDLSTIFNDIYALLRPNGMLFIAVPNFDFELFGNKCLSIIGAVHPLGFNSEFFKLNLPKIGFSEVLIYENWDLVPKQPVSRSSGPFIVVVAKKL